MNVNIKYTGPGGRRYNSATDMFTAMSENVKEQAINQTMFAYEKFILGTVSNLTCPEHGSKIEHAKPERDGNKMRFAFDVCCKRLEEVAQQEVAIATDEGRFKL